MTPPRGPRAGTAPCAAAARAFRTACRVWTRSRRAARDSPGPHSARGAGSRLRHGCLHAVLCAAPCRLPRSQRRRMPLRTPAATSRSTAGRRHRPTACHLMGRHRAHRSRSWRCPPAARPRRTPTYRRVRGTRAVQHRARRHTAADSRRGIAAPKPHRARFVISLASGSRQRTFVSGQSQGRRLWCSAFALFGCPPQAARSCGVAPA